jgi:PhnB protein
MLSINPYLNFPGSTEEAMNFYKSILGGEFTAFQRYGEIPGGERMPEADKTRVIHIALQVNKTTTIMATDALSMAEATFRRGNDFSVCIQAESEAEVDRIFDGMAAGGKIEMPVNKTFWGAYFGICIDKYGVQWMINYSYNK